MLKLWRSIFYNRNCVLITVADRDYNVISTEIKTQMDKYGFDNVEIVSQYFGHGAHWLWLKVTYYD